MNATTVALETPLHHAELQALAQQSAAADAGVTLNERRLTGQLVLRVRGDLDVASTAIESVVGLGLPDRLRFSGNPCSYAERSMAWLSPDEWRLCCPADEAFALENALRDKLAPLAGVSIAVVNNTGGFTLLDVAGKNATELLQKSTGYDIRNTANIRAQLAVVGKT